MAHNIVPSLRPVGRPAGAGPADLAPLVSPRIGARLRALIWPWVLAHAESITCGAVLLLSLLHLTRVYNRGFNLLDEGFVLHVAERVLQGQVPYRDFFTQLTPGAFVALAGVFAVTGPSVIVGRWVTVVIGLLITALLFTGGRRILSRPGAAVAALAFPVWGIGQGWFYPNYSWFALAAAMLALECTLRSVGVGHRAGTISRGSLAWAAGAGLCGGLAVFCKQNLGLYALMALFGTVLLAAPGSWRSRLAHAVAIGVGSIPVPLGLLLWLAGHGALFDFFRDAVWIPMAVFPKEMAAPYPAFWPPWPVPEDPPGQGAWAFRLVCLLPPLPYALAATKLLLQRLSRRPLSDPARYAAETAWLTFALAIWCTAFPRADFDHVQVALGPAFVVATYLLESLGQFAVRRRIWHLWGAPDTADGPALGRGPTPDGGRAPSLVVLAGLRRFAQQADGQRCRQFLPPLVAGGVIGCFLLAGLGNARALHMGPTWTLRTLSGVAPRANGILLDHDDAAELRLLVQEVRRLSAPGESIVSLPWNAGIYFLAERRNASRYDLFIPASVLPEDIPEITRSLDQARLIVYWTARDTFINNTSLDDRTPELHQHIMTRYRAVAAINAYRLLLRE